MGMFTRIATDAFESLQTDAGVILTTFDPYNPYRVPTDDEILFTTTGGITITAQGTFTDYAADVDNAVSNMKEFKRQTDVTASISCQSIKFNDQSAKWSLGTADVTTLSNGVKKVKMRRDILQTDFTDLWWVGDKADGGAYAVHLLNALSTGGLNIKTNKGGKGTNSLTITGHVGLAAQNDMPIEVYDIPAPDATAAATVTYTLTNATSTEDATSADIGSAYSTTISATSSYTLKDVHILMGGADITAEVYTGMSGEVSITAVTADLQIIATADTQYTVTNTLSHVTNSNAATKAFNGDTYTGVLTAADDYEISSVTVTMGGDDITDTAYTEETGTVSIARVTGNIVITATAETL